MIYLKKIYKQLAEVKSAIIEFVRKVLVPIRKKEIRRDFCIISNNCWGGKVYQRYGKSYSSPTVGLYFFSSDYISFLKDIDYYLSIPIEMLSAKESKNWAKLKQLGQENVPIGKLDDVEVVFLHYKTKEEAEQKWERRKHRVKKDNLIIKFSQMNGCTDEHIREFDSLPYKTKFVFTNHYVEGTNCCVYIPGYDGVEQILDDTSRYNGYVDLSSLINDNKVISKYKE